MIEFAVAIVIFNIGFVAGCLWATRPRDPDDDDY